MPPDNTRSQAPTRPSSARLALGARAQTTLLTAAIAVGIVGVAATIDGFLVVDRSNTWSFIALAASFALAERIGFQVETRHQAIQYAPSDLALALGILFLNPLGLIMARTIGAAVGLAVWRRGPLFKTTFNLVNFAFETILAVAAYRALVDGDADPSLLTWSALVAALLFALMIGGLLVATAISMFEGGFKAKLTSEVVNAPIFYLPGAVVAASIAIPMLIEPWLGLIALGPAPVLWFVVRSHGALLHRYTDLTSVHEFSREVSNVADPDDIGQMAVTQMAENLRAGGVALRIWDSHGHAVDVSQGSESAASLLPHDPNDPAWTEIYREGSAAHLEPDDTPATDLSGEAGQATALVAPMIDDRGPLGAIVLTDRQGAASAFDDDDRQRLTSMAQQLAVAVRKAQFHAQIQHEATHDRLTELPNRGYFEVWIDQALVQSQRESGAVLLIDLDRFKEINDTFGHHAGDELLKAVAERIRCLCGDADVAARFGGDEFAVFVPGAGDMEASSLADLLSVRLEEPFTLSTATVAIAASVGIAVAPHHGLEAVTLLRRADIAMYDAKRRHVRSMLYRDGLEENDSVRLALLADLRSALDRHELDVHYQPKVDLRTHRVVAAEALVRWSHPEYGPINPEVFVGLAEQAGLIEELTRQVLGSALAAVTDWRARGWHIGVAVNVSAQSLLDEQLEGLVSAELARSGADPDLLTLEITESTMMGDPARTHRILRALDRFGIRISVDDFGTGFSSLVNLRHLPVSELKIDRSFVTDMLAENNDEVIVKSTVDLGHNLGLTVVAEGVEDAEVQQRLTEMGCDVAQGYGISRPLPLDEFQSWVASANDVDQAVDDGLNIMADSGDGMAVREGRQR